jgi:biotin carboxyl carrier protein
MEVRAHMTGTIQDVFVEPGERVQAGDELVILESMKMEMAIEATEPGTVREVFVQPGAAVREDDLLMMID